MDWKTTKKHGLDVLKASLAAALITFLTTLLQSLAQIDFGSSIHAMQAGAGFVAIKAAHVKIV